METFMSQSTDDNKDLQGEGNYDATRRYDKAAHEFVEAGKVEEAARAARPASPEEAAELIRAERTAKSRSKGEDPATTPALPAAKP